ncbi:hypothetical protein PR048_007691, partial [Dryococelus australis]
MQIDLCLETTTKNLLLPGGSTAKQFTPKSQPTIVPRNTSHSDRPTNINNNTTTNSGNGASTGTQGREKREIPEETHRPTASSGTIPTYENPGVNQPEIEPGSPWWEASCLTYHHRVGIGKGAEPVMPLQLPPPLPLGELDSENSVFNA